MESIDMNDPVFEKLVNREGLGERSDELTR